MPSGDKLALREGFGNPTNKRCRRFIAICRGEETLDNAFEEIVKYSRKQGRFPALNRYSQAHATILLLTDKWDTSIFNKYEAELVMRGIDHDIWYIFLLVTEYGYVQIPFFPNERKKVLQIYKRTTWRRG